MHTLMQVGPWVKLRDAQRSRMGIPAR